MTDAEQNGFGLQCQEVSHWFGETKVLYDLNLKVDAGQFVSLIGPSGCGKSTLLNIIGGLLPADGGEINLNSRTYGLKNPSGVVDVRRNLVGWIFQDFHLLEHLSAMDNVAMALEISGVPSKEAEERAKSALARVNLSDRMDHIPDQLSGGQQQMLAIGRGLMLRPKLMLLDEPSLGLSPKLVSEISEIISRLNREQGVTILLVEQNAKMALDIGDYGFVMELGRIVMEDTCSRLKSSTDIQEFYLGMKEEGVRGRRRWKQRKTWR